MRHKAIDYYTVLGLAIFMFLSGCYIVIQYAQQTHTDLSFLKPSVDVGVDTSSPSPSLHMPSLSLDWLRKMDPAQKIIFVFMVIMLVGSLLGSIWAYKKFGGDNRK